MKPSEHISMADFKKLAAQLDGELRFDQLSKILYATDASAYREMPLAVALPKSKADVEQLIRFARNKKVSLIPRGAGTSLAGQVVGHGMVVDVSKYMNRVLEVNVEEKWVRVEPGVILSELNLMLKPHGLMFGPETSTANRCTMGGMLGNNSCGLHSLVHGSVREHVLEVDTLLSDGSEVLFGPLDEDAFQHKLTLNTLEGIIYRQIFSLLDDQAAQNEIVKQYPHPSVPRRNNGYALDMLLHMQPFRKNGELFNFAKLLAGSEGTLAFTTAMKLNLVPLPPPEKALLCVHFHKLEDAFHANLTALKYQPSAVELMDKAILDQTKMNIALNRNRFFIEGDPAAVLIIELWSSQRDEIISRAEKIEQALRNKGLGYHFPLIWGSDIPRVWALRTAGLGVLSNMPGDAKPVSVVEDTAIPVERLPQFLHEFRNLLKSLQLEAVFHAHIATGELHLRPVLNLKDQEHILLFRKIAIETARLVKKYHGALSGEHGDGRLRGEFIPFMLGNKVYEMLKELKQCWDPQQLFNPGKIIDTPPMHDWLRFQPGQETPALNAYFDYKLEQGMARSIEKCNGTADCRKSEIIGGTMCPSFMATRDELHSTRGRANVLRELITRPSEVHWADQHDVLTSLDLCLSCKACKSECPSGVDMARLKADFLQNHYDGNPVSLRTRLIAHYPAIMQMAARFHPLSNWFMQSALLSAPLKLLMGFALKRPLPVLSSQSLHHWKKWHQSLENASRCVYLFNDEFLDVNDSPIGIKTILLLEKLGYEVLIPQHVSSGRTFLSKGLVRRARKLARKNVLMLSEIITNETPLLGIEPSAILSFRDEYPDLVGDELKAEAQKLAKNTYMIDEFLVREFEAGRIRQNQFTRETVNIKLHGHCHQKALATTAASVKMLQIPLNYKVEEIPSGCCGMAGSFGYEKEHYKLSMQIGEMVLFPAVRQMPADYRLAAPGTSCREQIVHGTGKKALHPVEILYEALR